MFLIWILNQLQQPNWNSDSCNFLFLFLIFLSFLFGWWCPRFGHENVWLQWCLGRFWRVVFFVCYIQLWLGMGWINIISSNSSQLLLEEINLMLHVIFILHKEVNWWRVMVCMRCSRAEGVSSFLRFFPLSHPRDVIILNIVELNWKSQRLTVCIIFMIFLVSYFPIFFRSI